MLAHHFLSGVMESVEARKTRYGPFIARHWRQLLRTLPWAAALDRRPVVNAMVIVGAALLIILG